MYRVGIVGAGVIGALHAEAVAALNDVELLAVMDTDRGRAEKFAEKYDATAYSELDAFLREAAVDIVSICTPSGLHRDTALAAAKAGKHLLVEKPLEVTTSRANEIREACKRARVRLGGVFQTRFHPAAQWLKRAVGEGWFGRISLVSAEVKWYRSQEYYEKSGWRGTWKLDGGGALMNQSIHVVDMLLWLFGFPKGIHAEAALRTHDGLEVEDTIVAALRFCSGVLGTIQATTGAWPGSFKAVEVCGELGHVRLEENRFSRWEFAPSSPGSEISQAEATGAAGDVKSPTDIGSGAHRAQYADFLRSLSGEVPPSVTAHDAVEAVRLVERIYDAAGIGPTRPPLSSD